MLQINDTIIVEVRRENAAPSPPVIYTTPLAGIGGDFTSQKPIIKRQFFINNSDFSDYVMEWPTLVSKWDDARPRDLKIKLLNSGHKLNSFFSNRPTLNSSVFIAIGYENVTALNVNSGAQLEFYSASIASPHSKTICFHTAVESGSFDYEHYTFWRSGNTDAGSGYIEVSKTDSNYLRLDYHDHDTSNVTLETTDFVFYPGRYHHVCAYVGSDNLALYVDAALVSSATHGSNPLATIDPRWLGYIGGKDTTKSFRIADVRIYSQVTLSYAEINNIRYGAGDLIGPQPQNHHKFQLNLKDSIKGYDDTALGELTYTYGPPSYPTMKTVFRGRLDGLVYDDGKVTLNLIDKMHPLGEKTIGTPNAPIHYTNALPSDIALEAIVSYGGLTRSLNVDSASFAKWSQVFSLNSIRMDATFTGQRPTEVLRTISQMTQSAIYTSHSSLNTYLYFNLFSELGSSTLTLNEAVTLDSEARLDMDDVINYQYIAADYDVSSNYHKTEVLAQDTVSAGNYGIREDKQKSSTLWFVGSISALYFANRSIAMNKEPKAKFKVTTGLMGLDVNISDTVIITDNLLELQGGNVAGGYRVLGKTVNLNDGTVKLEATEAGAIFTDNVPFRLDYSKLDGVDVLL
jgi:hypothetical protein